MRIDHLATNICVLLGSVRTNRNGERLAKYIVNELEKCDDVSVQLIDPKDLNLPILMARYDDIKDSHECPPSLHGLQKTLTSCTSLIIVSPEYNHAIPPAVSNTLDYFSHAEFYFKPVGLVTYSVGQYGGVRAGSQYASYLRALGLVGVPRVLSVPEVQNTLDKDGHVLVNSLRSSFSAFADELMWFDAALSAQRETGLPGHH